MFTKIAVIGAVLTVCNAAGLLVDDGHGHAVSSQSFIRHEQPGHIAQYAPVLQHSAPLLQHAEPIIQKSVPLLQQTYSDNSLYQSGPLVHQYTPAFQHSPLVQHITPVAAKLAASPAVYAHDEHYNAPAKYEFSYSVEDPHTGDHKSQHEARDGDIVKGDYSLLQPDGSIRKVEYTADAHSGFNAVVHNSAPTVHAQDAHAPLLQHAEPIYEHHH